ncbi:primosomal protein N' [Nocardioidaceae bacterium]|nr:primosomal protein N' [Nocardioidaceae bacterium]
MAAPPRAAVIAPADVVAAPERPVARVLAAVGLLHLDRTFDYLVTADQHEAAVPGARVRVRFAGQEVEGFVLERAETTDHVGTLTPLRRVAGSEAVLRPDVADLLGLVAERFAGSRADVLRLAVPPRHATTERRVRREPPASPTSELVARASERWADGHGSRAAGLLTALADGASPRAVWTCPPGESWPDRLAELLAATAASGRGAIACVPDTKDLERLDAALTALLGKGVHAVLTADGGPAKRYGAFLSCSRGEARIAIGTRSAAYAPVHDLGLVAIWDDGDDLHHEPRAPYPHTREVLLLRASASGAAAVVGAYAQSAEAHLLVESGWARHLTADRAVLRDRVQVEVVGGDPSATATVRDVHAPVARIPGAVHQGIKRALADGPVLVQVPRGGYVSALACAECRTPARCSRCTGPVRLPGPDAAPVCRWCGHEDVGWRCPECGSARLRAPVRGRERTVEELGRSFPGTSVRTSGGDHVLSEVTAAPALVVCTPGAEPVADGGYAAVVLLDTSLALARADLRVAEEAFRRWVNAAALVRPASAGGRVLAVGDPAEPVLQALVRWDPVGLAAREVAERRSAHLPPASRTASLTGSAEAVAETVEALGLPPAAEVLGPVPVDVAGPPGHSGEEAPVRALVRVPRTHGAALSHVLREAQARRSARKLPVVRVQVDPPLLL